MRGLSQIISLCIASTLLYAAYAAMGSSDDDKKIEATVKKNKDWQRKVCVLV